MPKQKKKTQDATQQSNQEQDKYVIIKNIYKKLQENNIINKSIDEEKFIRTYLIFNILPYIEVKNGEFVIKENKKAEFKLKFNISEETIDINDDFLKKICGNEIEITINNLNRFKDFAGKKYIPLDELLSIETFLDKYKISYDNNDLIHLYIKDALFYRDFEKCEVLFKNPDISNLILSIEPKKINKDGIELLKQIRDLKITKSELESYLEECKEMKSIENIIKLIENKKKGLEQDVINNIKVIKTESKISETKYEINCDTAIFNYFKKIFGEDYISINDEFITIFRKIFDKTMENKIEYVNLLDILKFTYFVVYSKYIKNNMKENYNSDKLKDVIEVCYLPLLAKFEKENGIELIIDSYRENFQILNNYKEISEKISETEQNDLEELKKNLKELVSFLKNNITLDETTLKINDKNTNTFISIDDKYIYNLCSKIKDLNTIENIENELTLNEIFYIYELFSQIEQILTRKTKEINEKEIKKAIGQVKKLITQPITKICNYFIKHFIKIEKPLIEKEQEKENDKKTIDNFVQTYIKNYKNIQYYFFYKMLNIKSTLEQIKENTESELIIKEITGLELIIKEMNFIKQNILLYRDIFNESKFLEDINIEKISLQNEQKNISQTDIFTDVFLSFLPTIDEKRIISRVYIDFVELLTGNSEISWDKDKEQFVYNEVHHINEKTNQLFIEKLISIPKMSHQEGIHKINEKDDFFIKSLFDKFNTNDNLMKQIKTFKNTLSNEEDIKNLKLIKMYYNVIKMVCNKKTIEETKEKIKKMCKGEKKVKETSEDIENNIIKNNSIEPIFPIDIKDKNKLLDVLLTASKCFLESQKQQKKRFTIDIH